MAAIYYPLFHGVLSIPVERMVAAKYIYMFLAASTFFTIITVPYDALINAHEDFLYYSIVGIVVALLKLLAALAVVWWQSDRLILYGLLMAAVAVLNMLVMRIYCHHRYAECSFHPRRYADREVMRRLGAFAGWNFVGAFANIFGNHGSTILMNHFFGPVLIAAKNIGDQICSQVAVLTSNMTKALNPVIMKLEGGGDRQAMVHLTLASCRYSFLLYLIVAAPFLMNTEYLLRFWLHTVPAWAVLFCQLQVIRTLFEQLITPLRTAIMAQGSIRLLNLSELVLGILTLSLLGVCYYCGARPMWHYYVSIALLVFLSGGVKMVLCRKYCGMTMGTYIRSVLLRAAVCSGIVTALYLLSSQIAVGNILSLIYSLVISAVICTPIMLNLGELKLIINTITKFRR